MNRVFRCVKSILDLVCQASWRIAGAAAVLMAIAISYNVVRRYAFNQQDPYAYVVTCVLMLICVVFALAEVQRQDSHLRVDLLDRYLSQGVKSVIQKFVSPLLGLIAISITTWKSWTPAWMAFLTGDTYGSGVARVVTWPSRMLAVFGVGLLALVLFSQVLCNLLSLRKGRPAGHDGSKEVSTGG